MGEVRLLKEEMERLQDFLGAVNDNRGSAQVQEREPAWIRRIRVATYDASNTIGVAEYMTRRNRLNKGLLGAISRPQARRRMPSKHRSKQARCSGAALTSPPFLCPRRLQSSLPAVLAAVACCPWRQHLLLQSSVSATCRPSRHYRLPSPLPPPAIPPATLLLLMRPRHLLSLPWIAPSHRLLPVCTEEAATPR
ncbi:hypothetical protein E2562_018238 [Oryza meyeriana var. granulata]|uniref:Rx N-terminal domain-containing protein n=1 Tax=Oryza meyeriana var. granulata TaxID=110450 RepID=A0A6G1CHU6_9ORYZ|nr:hypothetical protein E2562_018238 [Oryza meyeriana var. granulata]